MYHRKMPSSSSNSSSTSSEVDQIVVLLPKGTRRQRRLEEDAEVITLGSSSSSNQEEPRQVAPPRRTEGTEPPRRRREEPEPIVLDSSSSSSHGETRPTTPPSQFPTPRPFQAISPPSPPKSTPPRPARPPRSNVPRVVPPRPRMESSSSSSAVPEGPSGSQPPAGASTDQPPLRTGGKAKDKTRGSEPVKRGVPFSSSSESSAPQFSDAGYKELESLSSDEEEPQEGVAGPAPTSGPRSIRGEAEVEAFLQHVYDTWADTYWESYQAAGVGGILLALGATSRMKSLLKAVKELESGREKSTFLARPNNELADTNEAVSRLLKDLGNLVFFIESKRCRLHFGPNFSHHTVRHFMQVCSSHFPSSYELEYHLEKMGSIFAPYWMEGHRDCLWEDEVNRYLAHARQVLCNCVSVNSKKGHCPILVGDSRGLPCPLPHSQPDQFIIYRRCMADVYGCVRGDNLVYDARMPLFGTDPRLEGPRREDFKKLLGKRRKKSKRE